MAVGWLILGFQHPNLPSQPEQAKPDKRVGDALLDIAATYDKQSKGSEASPESRPCERGDDHRDSDLCAQWKAADAAEEAAWWAAFTGWFGGLSFLGVLAALSLAFHSNWIARDTARRQLRAYIGVAGCSITELENNKGFMLQIELKNAGQTPAFGAGVMGETFVAQFPLEGGKPHPRPKESHRFPVNPSESFYGAYRLLTDTPQLLMQGVLNGECAIYIQGVCEYTDVFGRRRETQFRWVFGGRMAHTGGLVMHADGAGNSMT